MDYISTREAAVKWNISLRYVQRLLHEERIAGAKKYGVSWMIPADSEKPTCLRKAADNILSPAAMFPMLYIKGGDIDGAYERCGSEDERELFDIYLSVFRCDPISAKEKADRLFKKTTVPQLKLGCCLALTLVYMALGDHLLWKNTIADMAAIDIPENLTLEKELLIALANSAMLGRTAYPKWIETGAYGGLSAEFFPIARYVFVKILYIKWKEVDIIAVAEPLIAECHREKNDISEIYIRLMAASAYHDLDNNARAVEHIEAAADIALPNMIISPFIEHARQLPIGLYSGIKKKHPEQFFLIKKQIRLFFNNWGSAYNGLWDHPMAEGLTFREYEACILLSRGMAVNEIARRMGISKNSVKKYLKVAYNKMNIKEKSELSRLIHP